MDPSPLSHFGQLYLSELSSLVDSDRRTIKHLSNLAAENAHESGDIVVAVQKHLFYQCLQPHQLPLLYLVDYLIKVVKGPYLTHFCPALKDMFKFVWDRATGPNDQRALIKLVGTWRDAATLPPDIQAEVDQIVMPPPQGYYPQTFTVPTAEQGYFPTAPQAQSFAPNPHHQQYHVQPVPSFPHQQYLPPPPHPLPLPPPPSQHPTVYYQQHQQQQQPSHYPLYPQAVATSGGPGNNNGNLILSVLKNLTDQLTSGGGGNALPTSHQQHMPQQSYSQQSGPRPVQLVQVGAAPGGGGGEVKSLHVTVSRSFNPALIKEHYPSALEALMRSSDSTRRRFLDHRFIRNKRIKDAQQKNKTSSQTWYYPTDQWLMAAASAQIGSRGGELTTLERMHRMMEEGGGAGGEGEDLVSLASSGQMRMKKRAREPMKVEASGDLSRQTCAISGEVFERHYDSNDDKWYLVDAVVLAGEEAKRYGLEEGSVVKEHCLDLNQNHQGAEPKGDGVKMEPQSASVPAASKVEDPAERGGVPDLEGPNLKRVKIEPE